ncbi:MAG: signal peptidase I [Eubacteriaceae bacterium]
MKTVSNIISWVVIGLLLIGIAGFALPQIFGVKLFSILSGSMKPTYQVGDLIYTVPTDFKDIKVGDTITYVINEAGTVVTHRVIEKNEGEQTFRTQGDANNSPDGNGVEYKNVVGVVEFSIPQLGRIIEPLSTLQGKIIAGAVILIGIILMYLIPMIAKK